MTPRVGSNAASGNPATVREQNHIFGDPRLSPGAKCLAIMIRNLQAMELGACVLTREQLGERLAVSRATIQRYLDELRAVGWLVEERRPNRTPLRRIVLRPRLVGDRSEPSGRLRCEPVEGKKKKRRENLKPPRWALQVQREVREERDAVADSYGGVIPAE